MKFPLKVPRIEILEKFYADFFFKNSKLSRDTFWASSDHVVAEKSIFWKNSKKVANTLAPPWPTESPPFHNFGVGWYSDGEGVRAYDQIQR